MLVFSLWLISKATMSARIRKIWEILFGFVVIMLWVSRVSRLTGIRPRFAFNLFQDAAMILQNCMIVKPGLSLFADEY